RVRPIAWQQTRQLSKEVRRRLYQLWHAGSVVLMAIASLAAPINAGLSTSLLSRFQMEYRGAEWPATQRSLHIAGEPPSEEVAPVLAISPHTKLQILHRVSVLQIHRVL